MQNSGEKQDQIDIFIVLNPIAGHASVEDIVEVIETSCKAQNWVYEIYKTTGEENVAEITRAACQRGIKYIVAAGGDGTVAGVVNGAVHCGIPMGILPVGTGNALARTLGIPLEPKKAMDLITGPNTLMALDAMQVKNTFYILNVSAGISARTMDNTEPEQKRRFGLVAYAWTVIRQMIGIQPHRFILEIDNHRVEIDASEILISNGEPIKEPPFPLGPRDRYSDGQFDIYIVTARTLYDYINVLWDIILFRGKRKSDLRTLTFKQQARITTLGWPQPVQADGEVIGITPVEVKVVPKALEVVVSSETP